jgi:hypothetical protein
MSKTTIENSSKGYVLRCETCGEAYELQTVDRSLPLWAFKALCEGFEKEHSSCVELSGSVTQMKDFCLMRAGTNCRVCNKPNSAKVCQNCRRGDCFYCSDCCKKTETVCDAS